MICGQYHYRLNIPPDMFTSFGLDFLINPNEDSLWPEGWVPSTKTFASSSYGQKKPIGICRPEGWMRSFSVQTPRKAFFCRDDLCFCRVHIFWLIWEAPEGVGARSNFYAENNRAPISFFIAGTRWIISKYWYTKRSNNKASFFV